MPNRIATAAIPSIDFSPLAFGKWAVAGIVAWWFRDVPQGMQVLCAFMTIDVMTGFWAAALDGKLASLDMVRGLSRKTGTVMLLLLSHHIEALIHQELNIETWGAVAYTINEFVSILENLSRIGVPIPAPLVKALLAAKHLRVQPATAQDLKALRDDSPPLPPVL